jgi:2-hydroxy-6-oxo-octa-2,4-dienoate hydrolase
LTIQTAIKHPAIGKSVVAAGIETNYHELGAGRPVILLHGSGMGVSGWENWHRVMPDLAANHRVLAPDIVGFGFTERPDGAEYNIKLWVRHLTGFIEALGLEKPVLVGNSFGGSLALAYAARQSDKLAGMVLMGTPAGDFVRTTSSNAWYYEPSVENMGALLREFPYDRSIVTDEMITSRHEVTMLAGGLDAYRALFPEPGPAGEQKPVRGLPEAVLAQVTTPVLALHGREDKMIPLECGLRIAQHVPNAELHVFGQCGHWVQIERKDKFVGQTLDFISRLPN